MRASALRQLIREMLSKSVSGELEDLMTGDQRLRNEWRRYLTRAAGLPIPQSGYPDLATTSQAEKILGDAGFAETRARFVEEHGTTLDDMFGDKSRKEQILSLPDRLDWGSLTEDDWHNLAVLSQHMDGAPDFQVRMLKIFRQWRGEESSQYQYLADRISCRETGTQRFGTQDQGTNYANCKWVRD